MIVGIEVDGDGAMAEVSFDDGDQMYFKTEAAPDRARGSCGRRSSDARATASWASSSSRRPTGRLPDMESGVPGVVTTSRRDSACGPPSSTIRSAGWRPAILGRADRVQPAVSCRRLLAREPTQRARVAGARARRPPASPGLGRPPRGVEVSAPLHALRRGRARKDHRGRDGHQGATCPRSGRRVLILVPVGTAASVAVRAQDEVQRTLRHLQHRTPCATWRQKGAENPWMDHDSIITSHSWASWTEDRRAEIADVPWDMVVVDEAHHARAQRHGNSSHRTNLYRACHRSDWAARSPRGGPSFC